MVFQAIISILKLFLEMAKVELHGKFIQLLLANPKPYDAIICSSQCAVDMLRNSFAGIREALKVAYGASLPAPPSVGPNSTGDRGPGIHGGAKNGGAQASGNS